MSGPKCDLNRPWEEPAPAPRVLRVFDLPEFQGKKGKGYGGRCAGGAGTEYGGQYLIIAANDDVLAKVWEALEGMPLDEKLVYDAAAIKTARVEALVENEERLDNG